MSTSMRVVQRALAFTLGLVVVCGQMHWRAHALKVAHGTCEHGEVVHTKVSAPDDRPSTVTLEGANAPEAHEHGCSLLLLSRASESRHETTDVVERPPTSHPVAHSVPWTPGTAVVRLAPARSPPA